MTEIRVDNKVVILVRGAVEKPASLVLTQKDNESLAAAIENLPPHIEQLGSAVYGSSLVCLGVHPSDTVARRLARRLVRGEHGPLFFVGRNFGQADRAYWGDLAGNAGVIWINADPDVVIGQLTASLEQQE